jgi:homocysteine S-methyltransferase
MLETIEKMMLYSKKPMSAMPNAGHPQRVEGRNIYLCSPEYMSQYARRFLWAGVKIIGGCCGTTPEHIKLVRSEARSLQPGQAHIQTTVVEALGTEKPVQKMPKIAVKDKTNLGAKLAAGTFVAFVEILPPRGVDASKEIAGAALCKAAGIDCINVPDGPRASARMSSQVTCQLNHGLDISGNPMGSQTALLLGVGANPGALNIDEEIHRFELKVEAGAEYAVTQPVFDLDLLERFLKLTERFRIPVICGIWPLTSYRNAEFMVNELRVPVPEHFMERMRKVDNAEKARAEGVAIAREMTARVRQMVQGVQLSAPFGRYQMAIDVAEAIGPR